MKQSHGVLLQYHDFIVSNLDLVSFEELLPPFEAIVKDYGIEPSVAFYLWRPILAEKVRKHDVDLSIESQKKQLLQDLTGNEKAEIKHEIMDVSKTGDGEMQDVSHDLPSSPPGKGASNAAGSDVKAEAVEADEYAPSSHRVM